MSAPAIRLTRIPAFVLSASVRAVGSCPTLVRANHRGHRQHCRHSERSLRCSCHRSRDNHHQCCHRAGRQAHHELLRIIQFRSLAPGQLQNAGLGKRVPFGRSTRERAPTRFESRVVLQDLRGVGTCNRVSASTIFSTSRTSISRGPLTADGGCGADQRYDSR